MKIPKNFNTKSKNTNDMSQICVQNITTECTTQSHETDFGDNLSPNNTQTVVEFYWVLDSIAGVSILKDKNGVRTYRIHEPPLTPFEGELLRRLHTTIRDTIAKTRKRITNTDELREIAEATLKIFNLPLTEAEMQILIPKLFYYLEASIFGWGRLEVLRLDSEIEDISAVGWQYPVYLYHRRYRDMETTISFASAADIEHQIERFAQKSGKQLSLAHPIIDATLSDGSRIQMTYGDAVSARGSSFTIRKFRSVPYSVIDLLQNNTFTLDEIVYLWFAVEHNHSILIIGGTASGKTTTLNALSQFIPPLAKIVTLEDTRELMLHHGNWHASVVPDDETLSLFDLVTSAMRQRPEYLIVGEVRGRETLAMFQAMNTGHTTFSTFHAGDMKTALNRLQNKPLNVPKAMIETLDIVISQKRLLKNGEQIRRCYEIVEIERSNTDEFSTQTIARYHERYDAAEVAGSTAVFAAIKEKTGMSDTEFREEETRRRTLLDEMMMQNITGFNRVSSILDAYTTRPHEVIEHLQNLREV